MENNIADQYLSSLFEFIDWADGLLILAIILVIADLVFGVRAAKKRGEVVKRSRAIRRSMDKLTSYIIWIILSFTFGQAFIPFGIDLLPLIILGIIYIVELESIYVNYFQSRGIKAKMNLLKFFGKKTDLLEIELDDEDLSESKYKQTHRTEHGKD